MDEISNVINDRNRITADLLNGIYELIESYPEHGFTVASASVLLPVSLARAAGQLEADTMDWGVSAASASVSLLWGPRPML